MTKEKPTFSIRNGAEETLKLNFTPGHLAKAGCAPGDKFAYEIEASEREHGIRLTKSEAGYKMSQSELKRRNVDICTIHIPLLRIFEDGFRYELDGLKSDTRHVESDHYDPVKGIIVVKFPDQWKFKRLSPPTKLKSVS
jgi:hypothetical protein